MKTLANSQWRGNVAPRVLVYSRSPSSSLSPGNPTQISCGIRIPVMQIGSRKRGLGGAYRDGGALDTNAGSVVVVMATLPAAQSRSSRREQHSAG